MPCEGFLQQRRRTLVVALEHQIHGEIHLRDRSASDVAARFREPEGFADDRLRALRIGVEILSRDVNQREDEPACLARGTRRPSLSFETTGSQHDRRLGWYTV